ncbi:MAG: hypothetical protein RL758_961 [Pseudomonadota bacterium]|jgi:uncharacterized protein (TIGR02449 family)
MAVQTYIDEIAARIDRLLARHEELQRTNALLQQQLQQVTQERDQLSIKCQLVKQRLDGLIERLPELSEGEDA